MLSPNCSTGSPSLSSKARYMFVIGVSFGVLEVPTAFDPAVAGAEYQERQIPEVVRIAIGDGAAEGDDRVVQRDPSPSAVDRSFST